MNQLDNCPSCDAIFVKTRFRDVCEACFKEEEKEFDLVYTFIRKRENRTATINEVVDATGVSETKVIKFIKSGRLSLAQFPNITYPCSRCGAPTRDGELCSNCTSDIRQGLKAHDAEQEHRKRVAEKEQRERQVTYYAVDEKFRKRR